LSLLFLVIVAAIVLDLGQAVVTGRRMQNAADAASLAGTRQLDKVRLSAGTTSPVSSATVDDTVLTVAMRNGASAPLVVCTIIQWDQAPLGPCSNGSLAYSAQAGGVSVTAGASNATAFAQVLGVSQTRQSRTAAATVQPLIGQHAPLLVCAFGHPSPAVDIFVVVSAPGVTPVSYGINPAAVGTSYKAHAPNVSDCGLAGSAWKGDAGSDVFMVPGWLDIGTGVQAGPIRSQIAGQQGCAADAVGCVMALPVCSGSNGMAGSNGRLLCERFAVFKLVSQTSNSQTFTLMAGAEATSGIGGAALVGANEARLVKLVM
jgi:Flp pilus assembly protein TadG